MPARRPPIKVMMWEGDHLLGAPPVIAREMEDSAPTTRSADGAAAPRRRASLAPQTAPLLDGPPAPPRPRRASWPAPVPAPDECKEPSSTRSADLERFVRRRAETMRRATPDAHELEEQVRSALDDMVSTERRRTPPPAKKRPSLASQLFRPRSASNDDNAKLASQLYGGSMTSSRRRKTKVAWNHPDSLFRQRWILAVIIATLYCAVELPVELAFYPGFQVLSFKFWFDICIDLFFVADICVSLKTGFVEDGVVIMDPKRIRQKYCRSGFVVDLIAVLPFDVAMAFAGSGNNNESLVAASTRLGRVARLSRLLRLGRVARLFRYSQHYLGGLHEGHVRILALTSTAVWKSTAQETTSRRWRDNFISTQVHGFLICALGRLSTVSLSEDGRLRRGPDLGRLLRFEKSYECGPVRLGVVQSL